MVLLAIAGCSSGNKPNEYTKIPTSVTPTPSAEVQVKEPDVEQTIEPTEEPIVEQDFFSLHGDKFLPRQVELPSYADATQTEYLYRLNVDLDHLQVPSYLSVENGVVFCGDHTIGEGILFNFESGKQLSKVNDLQDYMLINRLANGGFWTVVAGNLETTLYDTTGKGNVVRKAEEKGCCSFAYVTKDGRYELFDNENGDISIYSLADGTINVVYSGSSYNRVISEDEQGCYVELMDDSVLYVQPELRTAKLMFDRSKDTSDIKYYPFWPYMFTESAENVTLFPVADVTKKVEIAKNYEEQYIADVGYGVIALITNQSDAKLTFYNMRTQAFIGEIVAPENSYIGPVEIMDNGFAMISYITEDRMELYIYDLVSERKTESWPVTISDRADEFIEPNAVVKELNEQYGIRVFYGENCAVPECDKKADVVTDEKQVEASINALKEFLETLPEGMVQEMYKGMYRGINIYLCGKITDIGDGNSNHGGFAFVSDANKIVIAVDVTVSEELIRYTLAHEFSHAFEHRIRHVQEQSGVDWLTKWERLIPDSIKNPYFETYDIGNKAMDYTVYGTQKEIWFADEYSRTFPTEDRARIFEYMFMPEDGHISSHIDYDNLKKKARYYALMLRNCFDSCKQAKDLPWEQYIGQIEESEFSTLMNS